MQGQHRLHQGKFVAYDESAKVPLLIRGPGIPAGTVSSELVSNVDLVPTLIEAGQAVAGITMDGRSLLPYARDGALRTKRPILLETGKAIALADPASASAAGGKGKKRSKVYVKNSDLDRTAQLSGRVIKPPKYRAIRTSRYLLIKSSDGGRELYDMAEDPEQVDSVYKDFRYQPVVKYLLKKLAKLTPCVGSRCNAEIQKPPKLLKEPQAQDPEAGRSRCHRVPADGGRATERQEAAGRVNATDTLGIPLGPGQPPALMEALGKRDDWEDLRVYGALLLVGTELFNHPNVHYLSGFFGPIERALRDAGANIGFAPADFRRFAPLLAEQAPAGDGDGRRASRRRRLVQPLAPRRRHRRRDGPRRPRTPTGC